MGKNKEKLTFLLPDFGLAGALVVDGTTGRVVANGWTPAIAIDQLPLGTSAFAHVAERGECFVLECAEDECACDSFAHGSFNVYPATDSSVIVPMKGMHQSRAYYGVLASH